MNDEIRKASAAALALNDRSLYRAINRKLLKLGGAVKLKKTRGENLKLLLGEYHEVDVQGNYVFQHHVDLWEEYSQIFAPAQRVMARMKGGNEVEKKAAKLQVVLKCGCGMVYTPSLTPTPDGHNVPLKCSGCFQPLVTNDPHARWEYLESIKTLLKETLQAAPLAEALGEATFISQEVRSPFTISLRTRKEE
jgi:hypothetical protein